MSKKEKRQKTRRNHRVSARDKGVGVLLLLIITGLLDKYIAFCVGDGGSGLWGGLFFLFKSVAERFI